MAISKRAVMVKRRNGSGKDSIAKYKYGRRWSARYSISTSSGPKFKVVYGRSKVEAESKLAQAHRDSARKSVMQES